MSYFAVTVRSSIPSSFSRHRSAAAPSPRRDGHVVRDAHLVHRHRLAHGRRRVLPEVRPPLPRQPRVRRRADRSGAPPSGRTAATRRAPARARSASTRRAARSARAGRRARCRRRRGRARAPTIFRCSSVDIPLPRAIQNGCDAADGVFASGIVASFPTPWYFHRCSHPQLADRGCRWACRGSSPGSPRARGREAGRGGCGSSSPFSS